MNKNWTKWILASVYNHYKNILGESAYVEGEPKTTNVAIDRYELKTIGPDYIQLNENTARIELNILVLTGYEIKDPLKHSIRIGQAQEVFSDCINIYKLGKTDLDDKSLFNTLIRQDAVNTTHFTYDPVVKLMRSTTDTTYIVNF